MRTSLLIAGRYLFSKKKRNAATLCSIRMFLIFIPAVLLLPTAFGLDGVYYAHPLADFLSVGIMFVVVWRALRK